MTCPMMSAVPPKGSTEADAVSVIVEPEGARSGTRSHPMVAAPRARHTPTPRTARPRARAIMKAISILNPMQLRGQAGYAMAALLVAISIMMVMMTVAMPVYKQAARREKEDELVFRGEQY